MLEKSNTLLTTSKLISDHQNGKNNHHIYSKGFLSIHPDPRFHYFLLLSCRSHFHKYGNKKSPIPLRQLFPSESVESYQNLQEQSPNFLFSSLTLPFNQFNYQFLQPLHFQNQLGHFFNQNIQIFYFNFHLRTPLSNRN